MKLEINGTTEDCEHFREINRKLWRGFARFAEWTAFILLSTFFLSICGTILVFSIYAIIYNASPFGIYLHWLGIPETRWQGISDLLRLVFFFSILLAMALTDLGGRKYWVGMVQCASNIFKNKDIAK